MTSSPLPLVLDASSAVAEALRARGLALFLDERLELVMSEAAWSETEHELRRRVAIIAEQRSFLPGEQASLLSEATTVLKMCLDIIPAEAYAELEATAHARVPADPNDWSSAALALALNAGIWTEDRDFFGSGIATWRTAVLQHHLTETR